MASGVTGIRLDDGCDEDGDAYIGGGGGGGGEGGDYYADGGGDGYNNNSIGSNSSNAFLSTVGD